MIPEQWVSEIVSRFPYYSNKPENEQSALRGDLIDFATGKPPNVLEDLLSEFRTTEFKRAPGIWWFYQRVKKDGIDTSPSWRECDNHHIYHNNGSSCPVCGSTWFKLHLGESIPSEAIQVQDGCSQCNWYKESLSHDVPRLYGPMCNEYGDQERGTQEICKSCKCSDCCNLDYLINNDPNRYRQRYGDLIDNQFVKMYTRLSEKMGDKWKKATG